MWGRCGAALLLAASAAPLCAQAIKPSSDGRFEECLTRKDFNDLSPKIGFPAVIVWFDRDTPGAPLVRRALNFKVAERPADMEWMIWSGWNKDRRAEGRDPELVCMLRGGHGVLLLREGSALPSAPFGLRFADNDGWYVDPNSFVKGTRTTNYQACRSADAVIRARGGKSKGCEAYAYQGLDAQLRNEGFLPRVLLRADGGGRSFLILYLGASGRIRTVSVDTLGYAKLIEEGYEIATPNGLDHPSVAHLYATE